MGRGSLHDEDLDYVPEGQAWVWAIVGYGANTLGLLVFFLCSVVPPLWLISGILGTIGLGVGWWSLRKAIPLQTRTDVGASFGVLMASAIVNITFGCINMMIGVLMMVFMLWVLLVAGLIYLVS